MYPFKKINKKSFGRYVFDPSSGEIVSESWRKTLAPKDCQVLCCLLEQPLAIVSKEEFFETVWPNTIVSEGVLKASIKRIRRILCDDYSNPIFIETLRGRGYRFICETHENNSRYEHKKVVSSPSAYRNVSSLNTIKGTSRSEYIVGRNSQLRIMVEQLSLAVNGTCRAVFVSGKAGMGKTALVRKFVDDCAGRDDITIVHGQCNKFAETSEACLPFLMVLENLSDIYDELEFKSLLHTYAPMWLLHLPWLLKDDERELLAAELQGVSNTRMMREMSVLIEVISLNTPIVWIMEDLHWSDLQTLGILSHILQKITKAKVLIVGTFRLQKPFTDHFSKFYIDLLTNKKCVELQISCLRIKDIHNYLKLCGMSGEHVDAVGAWLYKNTEGHPLFMQNLYRYVLEEGWLVCHGNAFTEKIVSNQMARVIPRNLRELINCQIDRLEEKDQMFLEFISVFGMRFNTFDLDCEDITLALSIEQSAERLTKGYEFLQRAGSKPSSEGRIDTEYCFTHSWFQKIAYERLAPKKCAFYHAKVGRQLERLYKDALDQIADAIALHFEKGGDIVKAVKYRIIAGQVAFKRFSTEKAFRHFQRALKLLESLPKHKRKKVNELEILVPLGSILVATKGYAHHEVERIYGRAHALCLKADKNPQLLATLYGLCNYHMVKGNLGSCTELQTIFINLASDNETRDTLPWGYSVSCMVNWYQGKYAESCKFASYGIDIYEPAAQRKNSLLFGMDGGLVCMMHKALAQWLMGYPQSAKNEMSKALEIASDYGNPFMKSFSLCFAGWLQSFLRNYNETNAYAVSSLELAADHGIEYWNIQASILREWASMMANNGNGTLKNLQSYINAHQTAGAKLIHGKFLFLQAECIAKSGSISKALSYIEEGLQLIDTLGENWWKAEFLRLKGDLLLELYKSNMISENSSIAEIEELYFEAIEVAAGQSAKSLELRAAMSLWCIWSSTEKKEQATIVLKRIYNSFTEGFETYDLKRARLLLNSDHDSKKY